MKMRKSREGIIFTNTRKSLPILELKDFFWNNVTLIGIHVTIFEFNGVAATGDCGNIPYLSR
jgi:hypothetical protein